MLWLTLQLKNSCNLLKLGHRLGNINVSARRKVHRSSKRLMKRRLLQISTPPCFSTFYSPSSVDHIVSPVVGPVMDPVVDPVVDPIMDLVVDPVVDPVMDPVIFN